VTAFRKLSDKHYFNTVQVRQMYKLFDKEYSNLRVEILVTAFSRTIDFRGFFGSQGMYRYVVLPRFRGAFISHNFSAQMRHSTPET